MTEQQVPFDAETLKHVFKITEKTKHYVHTRGEIFALSEMSSESVLNCILYIDTMLEVIDCNPGHFIQNRQRMVATYKQWKEILSNELDSRK